MIKGVIFDLDGTLVDTVEVWADIWERAFKEEGLNVGRDEIKRFVGLPLDGIIKSLGIHSEELERRIADKKKDLVKLYADKARLFPDVVPVLEYLRDKNIKVCVASSSLDEWIKYMLKKFRLEKFVDSYVSGYNVKRPKPEPDVFIEAFRRIGIDPKDGMVVGDRESDVIPAIKIGAKAALIDRLGETKDPKEYAVIKNLEELKKMIR
ncbi:MAG: HAD family hydrolase [Candidatus Micrarchaeia archaeon]